LETSPLEVVAIFSVPPTQISLEKGHWVDHHPVSSVADGVVITFLSPGTEDYVDLARTILVVRAKVMVRISAQAKRYGIFSS
jgi:hypothetical protein